LITGMTTMITILAGQIALPVGLAKSMCLIDLYSQLIV
jgi:hypothetical protein